MSSSAQPPFLTAHLPQSDLFRYVGEEVSSHDRIVLAHERAKAIGVAYDLTPDDILNTSEKLWTMYIDPINSMDGVAFAYWTLQLSLFAGTVVPYLAQRPELRPLVDSVLKFDVTAHYMLTEVAHGLDSQNIETTATLLPDGHFDLNTPHDDAAKFMPATVPAHSPRVAVVMARLIVEGRDHGIQPFIVPLNDGISMCRGVVCRPLPTRGGGGPFGHSVTSFEHVRLPPSAILGDGQSARKPRLLFLANIWRLSVGSICLASATTVGLKVAAYITAIYSKRRRITDPQGNVIPIITFRTQHAPIMQALAQAEVVEALYKELRKYYLGTPTAKDIERRNSLTAMFKATAIEQWRRTITVLADRCGAQGLFDYNQIMSMEAEARGATIAEGDVLVLCIRLASELLLGRYEMPEQRHPDCLLARHERGMFADMRAVLAQLPRGAHRGEEFNRRLLPRCVPLVQVIGRRMAYEAALDAGVDADLVALYEANAVLATPAWYVENGLLTQQAAFDREERALTAAFAHLDRYLEASRVAPYVFAAITTEEKWRAFFAQLPVLRGDAKVDPLRPVAPEMRAHL